VRSATPLMPRYSCATPNPSTASPFQSESSANGSSSTWLHAMCVYGESRETPAMRTPAASNSALLSRRSPNSSVQVDDQSKR
jgi:hypothetical protein